MHSNDFLFMLANALPMFVIFLFSLCFHEFSHAIVANFRGDPTAQMMGRMTLNPIVHMDPLGTVVLPLIGFMSGFPVFGWAKPVPVNELNLKRPRQDMFWIAAAGPLSNLLLAAVGIFAYVIFSSTQGVDLASVANLREWPQFMYYFVLVNLILMVFNLIPVHPLDGGKVLARFLPDSANQKLEENQQVLSILLIALIMMGGFRILWPIIMGIFQQILFVAIKLVV